jgi:CRISPR-associated protein Csd1
MILTALKELAEREGLVSHPAFEERAISYLLEVTKEGKCIGLRPLGQTGAARSGKIFFPVPRPLPGSRRSGTTIDPGFLVENASFLLGINAPGDTEKKSYSEAELRRRRSAFHDLIREAVEATKDEGVIAVDRFLSDLEAGRQLVPVPPELRSNALIAFTLPDDQGMPLQLRSSLAEYWGRRRAAAEPSQGEGLRFQCLVSGQPCSPIDKHPLVKKVPGGTPSGISFVSFNDTAFESYGLERSENAPVSRVAADAYTEALKRLLDESYPDPRSRVPLPKRHERLSQDTVVVFWSKGTDETVDLFADSVGQGQPEAVEALFRATWKGRPVNLDDPAAFYALTLSGGQGRGTNRGWLETTLGAALRNVKGYFGDLQIVRSPRDEGKPLPLLGLLRQLAVQGKDDNIPPSLAGEVFAAILAGRPFPRLLLDAAIRRTRAERYLSPDRAALIKGYLLRAKRTQMLPSSFPEVHAVLDEDCKDSAYRLGRLFAVLEKIQADATNATTTIRDRYYGAASATPIVVFPQLMRKAPHHLAKLRTGSATFYEKLIQSICGELQPPTPFPSAFSLEEQGLFAVGYYHQRQALFSKRDTTDKNASQVASKGE